jgi:hypothetical protein
MRLMAPGVRDAAGAELMERLRKLLEETFARPGSRRRNLAEYVAWWFSQREPLRATVGAHAGASGEREAQVVREVSIALLRQPSILTGVTSRTQLTRAWDQLLIDATAKVSRDERDAELYALAGAARSDDERAVSQAAARTMGRRWQGK